MPLHQHDAWVEVAFGVVAAAVQLQAMEPLVAATVWSNQVRPMLVPWMQALAHTQVQMQGRMQLLCALVMRLAS